MGYNTNIFICDSDNKDKSHLLYISEFCTNGTNNKAIYIPELDEKLSSRAGLAGWGLIVALFGVFGNLFTLISVPYASKRQRSL